MSAEYSVDKGLDHASARAVALLCRALVSDDAFAITHQSMGQYRTGLIAKLDGFIAECKPSANPLAQAAQVDGLVSRNPAPNAAAPMVPSGPTITLHVGAPTHPPSPDAADSGRVVAWMREQASTLHTDNFDSDGPKQNHQLAYAIDDAADRLAALAAQPQSAASPAGVPDGMASIGQLIATQDNRITDQPIFIVQQKRETVGHPDYDHSRIAWVSGDGGEARDSEYDELEAAFYAEGVEPDGWSRVAVCFHWEFVTACFTEKGCEDYLARDGHNLREPRIYAAGSYRNEEYRQVRSFLLSRAAAPSATPEGGEVGL